MDWYIYHMSRVFGSTCLPLDNCHQPNHHTMLRRFPIHTTLSLSKYNKDQFLWHILKSHEYGFESKTYHSPQATDNHRHDNQWSTVLLNGIYVYSYSSVVLLVLTIENYVIEDKITTCEMWWQTFSACYHCECFLYYKRWEMWRYLVIIVAACHTEWTWECD